MEKDYRGNRLPFILTLFDESDRDYVLRLTEAMEGNGFRFTGRTRKPTRSSVKRAGMILVFLSEGFSGNQRLQELFFAAVAAKVPILPVNLDGSEQSSAVQHAIFALNSVFAANYPTPEALAARLLTAEFLREPKVTQAQRAALRRRAAAVIAFSAAAAALALFMLIGSRETPAEPEIELPPGLTQEDLEKVQSVVLIGDHLLHFDSMPSQGAPSDFLGVAIQSFENDLPQWHWKEDDSEIQLASYDLDFLKSLPNLRQLYMVLVDTEALPDLSGLSSLSKVWIQDCTVTDISGLSGSSVKHFLVNRTPIHDYSALNGCERLTEVDIDLYGQTEGDLSGFGPEALMQFSLNNGNDRLVPELSSLSRCSKLKTFACEFMGFENLDFLSGITSLRSVEAYNCERLLDVSALGTLTELRILTLKDCENVRDLSSVANCRELEEAVFNYMGHVYDSSFLNGMKKLRMLELCGRFTDMEFLRTLGTDGPAPVLTLCIEARDYSPVAAFPSYAHLHLNAHSANTGITFASFAPVLEGLTFNSLAFYDTAGIDLSALPECNQLQIFGCDIEDLSGLPASVRSLELDSVQTLRSLSGLENSPHLTELRIVNCPRLTDLSAMNGRAFSRLVFEKLYAVPDFSSLTVTRNLSLRSIPVIDDLHILDGMTGRSLESRRHLDSLELVDLNVTDLSPLRSFSIDFLTVSPENIAFAEALRKEGYVKATEVSYPNNEWQSSDFRLLSADELETLPPALLSAVTELTVFGGEIVDSRQVELCNRWEDDERIFYLAKRGEEELILLENDGTSLLSDLSALSALTGLRDLRLYCQDIETLDGLEAMTELEILDVRGCKNLRDISAVFSLEALKKLQISDCPAASIQGIQNLPWLRELFLDNTVVEDLSPLAGCDLRFAEENGGFALDVSNLPCTDYSPLYSIRCYESLGLNLSGEVRESFDREGFWENIRGASVRRFYACGFFRNDGDLRAMVDAFGAELEELHIPWNETVTDLTPLLSLPKLQHLKISRSMEAAIASLNGADHGFELEIEG